MAAPKNNQYWKLRKKHGRPKNLKSPEELWGYACDYFQWCEDNPLKEEKLFAYQGTVTRETINKMRAVTWGGFESYLYGLDVIAKLEDYKANSGGNYKDFSDVITRIDKEIKRQKFEGAAADLLNPNIIARDLGLADKKQVESKVELTTDEDIEERIKELEKLYGKK